MGTNMNNSAIINNKTKFYAVIGDPISHSLSPVFQNCFMGQKNINAVYIPLKITAGGLSSNLELLKNNFSGFNVTIPHKENIMQYLDKVDPLAAEYEAVNTVKIVNNKLIGYNTDGIGFTKSIKDTNIDLKGKKVLLLGAGGAAKVIASEIIKLGGILTIANRNINRADYLSGKLQELYKVSINVAKLESINKSFDIVINSTPIGMYPNIDKTPISANVLQNTELVYDIIYNPLETKLIKLGNKFGAKTINGLSMLIYQGLKSFEIWTGKQATHTEKENLYKKLQNILSA